MKIRRMLILAAVVVMSLICLSTAAWAEEPQSIALDEVKTTTIVATGEDVDTTVTFQFTPEQSGLFALYVDEAYDYGRHQLLLDAYEGGYYAKIIDYKNMIVFEGNAGKACDLVIRCFGYLNRDLELSLRVEPWAWQYLQEGENAVDRDVDLAKCRFVPEKTGYYRIYSNDPSVNSVNVYAREVGDGDQIYYYLEADRTYDVTIFGEEETIHISLQVDYYESVDVIVPVAMELVSLPHTTIYPRQAFTDDPDYSVDFSGLAIRFWWNDGSETLWEYDRDGYSLGQYGVNFGFDYDGDIVTVEAYLPLLDVEPVSFELIQVDYIPGVDDVPDDDVVPDVDDNPGVGDVPEENDIPDAEPEFREDADEKTDEYETDGTPPQVELLGENKSYRTVDVVPEGDPYGVIYAGIVVLIVLIIASAIACVVWLKHR